MSPKVQQILEDALLLPDDARAELAGALFESLEPADDPAVVEAAWADEIARRIKEFESGAVKPVPWEEARRLIFETSGGASRR